MGKCCFMGRVHCKQWILPLCWWWGGPLGCHTETEWHGRIRSKVHTQKSYSTSSEGFTLRSVDPAVVLVVGRMMLGCHAETEWHGMNRSQAVAHTQKCCFMGRLRFTALPLGVVPVVGGTERVQWCPMSDCGRYAVCAELTAVLLCSSAPSSRLPAFHIAMPPSRC